MLSNSNSLHYLLYRLGRASPRSETTLAERDCLRRYATGRRRVVEIGVWHGVNSTSFREVMSDDGVVICVDPYPRFFFRLRGFGWARLIAHREVEHVRRGRVLWIEDLGKNAPEHLAVRELLPVDFVFFDGDHSYDGLKGDWQSWAGCLSPHAFVAFHDSRNANGCGSERLTTEVLLGDPKLELLETVDTLTVLKRVPARDRFGCEVA